jgi:hypothetical protein
MHPIDSYKMGQMRQEELLREAELERLVRAAMHHRSQRFHRRWANWLGVHLVRWGQRLESFGTVGETYSA